MTVCCNQTVRRESSAQVPKTLHGADLLFGARFFSYGNVECLLGKIDHRVIGMGTKFLKFGLLTCLLELCLKFPDLSSLLFLVISSSVCSSKDNDFS